MLLLENLRFHAGEEANDPAFAKALAALADVYVDDAFGAAHRSHASVVGVPKLVAEKGAGLLLEKEVRELSRLLEPERPFAAILGGAKISGKIDTLRVLSRRADMLLVGGGMANHFVRAIGLPVGRSLLEEDKVPLAREILDFCKEAGKKIALPSDFVVAKSPDDGARAKTVGIDKIPDDAMALDVGPRTLEQFERLLESRPDDLLERADGRLREAALRQGNARAGGARRGIRRPSPSSAAARASRPSRSRVSPTGSRTCRRAEGHRWSFSPKGSCPESRRSSESSVEC